ncbi:hypothetical protein SASPL_121142 [Salvia splendens]|uniref:Cation/H+ exchanger transmembrane domain-containing protein n=1 Tax=Salvia splendens TaxID=180675 RepID=A0A8X8XQY1_SALSN|nr:hypothetical protein SASPL_121142 [Salvia splendens]
MMLMLSFVLGHVLRRHRFYYLSEAIASLLISLIVGIPANVSNTENSIRSWFNFHEEFFFFSFVGFKRSVFVSLTWFRVYSIRIQSSACNKIRSWLYLMASMSMVAGGEKAKLNLLGSCDLGSRGGIATSLGKYKPFFSNFGAIVTFAIFGTFVASMVTGILVYLAGVSFLIYMLPFVECLMFGALISATDPVTVLSKFQELGTDVNLYALVFGESVLNDASVANLLFVYSLVCRSLKMAISLYRTMSLVRSHMSSDKNLFMVVVRFLETFVGSMSAGVGHLFKYAGLDIDKYMLAEGLGLSGIVSILFTGIVMKHYTFSNLSDKSQKFVAAFFHLISSLAETFIFIYMGFDIAMEQHSWSHLFIGIERAADVFSCAYLVNMGRPSHRKISMKHQKALWYSGLRGAMAFALALQSVHDLPEGHGQTIFTATTAIVVLTVLLIGGSTGTMLEALEVVGDGHEIPLGEFLAAVQFGVRVLMQTNGYIAPTYEGESSSGNRFKMTLSEFRKSTASFTENKS